MWKARFRSLTKGPKLCRNVLDLSQTLRDSVGYIKTSVSKSFRRNMLDASGIRMSVPLWSSFCRSPMAS